MKAPFPWFGGKSRVADIVWDRFGNVANYVEPFFGSGAVLLERPHEPQIETVNDLDCMVANFWRALQHDPSGVAAYADNPVNEADQNARHLWLSSQAEFREQMKVDPDYYDPNIAGWWVWGQCIWIGAGWCSVELPAPGSPHLPHLSDHGQGVHRARTHLGDGGKGVHRLSQSRPHLTSMQGVHRKRPHLTSMQGVHRHLSDGGAGIHRRTITGLHIPHLRNGGTGVNRVSLHNGFGDIPTTKLPKMVSNGIKRRSLQGCYKHQLPHLTGRSAIDAFRFSYALEDYLITLATRLRNVRVCCGDWSRILGPSPTFKLGITGVFLDPPYASERTSNVYNHDSFTVAHDVRAWAIENGNNPELRIALCGYDGEHEMPPDWAVVAWKATGGYGSMGYGLGRENAAKERIWFSPACINEGPLFQQVDMGAQEGEQFVEQEWEPPPPPQPAPISVPPSPPPQPYREYNLPLFDSLL